MQAPEDLSDRVKKQMIAALESGVTRILTAKSGDITDEYIAQVLIEQFEYIGMRMDNQTYEEGINLIAENIMRTAVLLTSLELAGMLENGIEITAECEEVTFQNCLRDILIRIVKTKEEGGTGDE